MVDVHSAQIYFAEMMSHHNYSAALTPVAPTDTTVQTELNTPWDGKAPGSCHVEIVPEEMDLCPVFTLFDEECESAPDPSTTVPEQPPSSLSAGVASVLEDSSLSADQRVAKICTLVAQAGPSGSGDAWMNTVLNKTANRKINNPNNSARKDRKGKAVDRSGFGERIAHAERDPAVRALFDVSTQRTTGRVDDVLNSVEDDPAPQKPSRRVGLAPIKARADLPPLDLIDLARKITFDLSLVYLMQLSPEFARQLRAMSGRETTRRKRSKNAPVEVCAASYVHQGHIVTTKDPTANIRAFSKNYAATRPFRVDCILAMSDSRHRFPDRSVQADQGSEMNIISPRVVKQFGLVRHPLSGIGFEGLRMTTAEGRSCTITHFVAIQVITHGIKRELWACIRPEDTDQTLLLLLGLPWLYDVRAVIDVFGARVMIGDTFVDGPLMAAATTHNLILGPAGSDPNAFIPDRSRLLTLLDDDSDDSEEEQSSDDDSDVSENA